MKKKISKIIVIMCVLITILPMQMFQALATGIGDSPYLERGDLGFYTIQYQSKTSGNWYYITYSRTWYTDEQGIRRIAYCVDPDLNGIGWVEGEVSGYHVDLNEALSDNRVWRVYRHGYPYVSASDLGVETEDDAYLATKQAAYWIIRGYSLEDIHTYFRPGETSINGQNLEDIQRRGKKVIDAIYHLVNLGYNGTETQAYNGLIKVNKNGEFTQDNNQEYYSQKYSVTSSTSMSGYTVKSITDLPSGSYIADLNGNEKAVFSSGEKFKVMIPKKSINENVSGKIEIEGKCQNYPVYYGKSRDNNTQSYAVTVDSYSNIIETTNLDINAYKSNIKLTKIDKETKEKLSGVKFNFKYENGSNIGDYTTDKKGEIYIKNLKQGTVIATEVETKNEYILDKKENKINLQYNDTTEVTIENEHKKGNLKVLKVDKDNNNTTLENVEFDLYSEEFKRVIGTYHTDKNGEIYVENLRTGSYKLIERNTNKWYNLNLEPTNTKVEFNNTTNTKIENELKKGQIKVIKVDLDNKEVKLKDVEFQVIDKNGNVLETIKTDENGEATTKKYAIRDYEKLTLKETKTGKFYVLNDKPQIITLKENEITNITFTNEKKKGQIKVIKVDLDNKEVKIPDVEFKVYDESGNVVDTLKTDKNGEATSKKLSIDKKYKVQESKTGKWYVLNKEPQTAVLKQDEITTLTFTNEKKKGQIRVIKVDLDNKEVKLKDVEFKVYDKNGNVVDTLKTDKNGEATTKRLPIDQEYTIQESKTLQNYVLNKEKQTVILTQDKITNITFENEKIKGKIEITKISEDNNKYNGLPSGTPLEGAVFDIYDSKNNIVDTITTGKDGKAITKLLVKGNYIAKEKDSGSIYYLLNKNEYKAEIKEHKENVPLIITNKSVEISVSVEKTGYIETQKNDTIKYNFSNIANTSNINLDSFKWRDYLPTDYIRLTEIVTGTWNQNVTYSITYKTNLNSEERVLSENLNSKENCKIDCTNVDLQDGEYITEYCFNFGRVDIGFKEEIEPSIFCKVLDTVKNKDVFTNKTETAGEHEGLTAKDEDEWTTVVYEKDVRARKLPRTGK